MTSRGRRRGGEDTRGLILAAARTRFAEHGYDGTSIRAVAAAAGVDPALVHHYFGTKAQLFASALELPFRIDVVLAQMAAPGDVMPGERLVRAFLSIWGDDETRRPAVTLLRSMMTNEQAATAFREFIAHGWLPRVAEALGLETKPERIALAASQLVGFGVLRYIIRVDSLTEMSEDQVVAALAPTIQAYLDPAGESGWRTAAATPTPTPAAEVG